VPHITIDKTERKLLKADQVTPREAGYISQRVESEAMGLVHELDTASRMFTARLTQCKALTEELFGQFRAGGGIEKAQLADRVVGAVDRALSRNGLRQHQSAILQTRMNEVQLLQGCVKEFLASPSRGLLRTLNDD
jgi:hypothetical protein